MLAEVYRNASVRRVCQVDIAETYEHKHQSLSQDDSSAGLNRMARDICKSLLRTLAMEGVVFGAGLLHDAPGDVPSARRRTRSAATTTTP